MIDLCVRCGDCWFEDGDELEDFDDVLPCYCSDCLADMGMFFTVHEFDWLSDIQELLFTEGDKILDCVDVN